MTALLILPALYVVGLAAFVALDCFLGWPMADAFDHPHPTWCPFPSTPTRAPSIGASEET